MTFYQLLGVSQNATMCEIRKGYLKKAGVEHPDKNPQNVERATEMMKRLNQAKDVLLDEQKRYKYDLSISRRVTLEPNEKNSFTESGDEWFAKRNGGKFKPTACTLSLLILATDSFGKRDFSKREKSKRKRRQKRFKRLLMGL